uniref:glutathione transferase n=1 Tax=Saccoglossus kowalevskii TaxID=10224 RepID=A0ABM0MYE5_SACKO|nr:PREDICTED: hematopoietic prostaglandin D synthase-like [Saccoglossus kowalevskii]
MAEAGVEYEDVIIDEFEEWPALKSSPGVKRFPFARTPILEVDGVTIAESRAIARFLARRHDLYAEDLFDQAKIDMITDTMKDIFEKLGDIWFAKENKQELMDKYYNDVFPLLLQGLERVLKENNDGDGYFVGDTVTLADLSFADTSYFMVEWRPDVLNEYPKLKALKKRVESRPRIAEWMKKRPESTI